MNEVDLNIVRELTVVLADDHLPTRVGIKSAIEPHGLRVVAEAGSAADALSAALAQRPDVCVLAVRLPGSGIEAARLIKQSLPETKVVMLSASAHDEELFAALRAGADGYLLMTTTASRLPHVIRGVVSGEAALPRELTARLIREFRERGHRRRLSISTIDPGVELTAREFEVLEQLRKRDRTAEIAARLEISEITVRRHVSSILNKLGLPNRNSAIELLERAEQER
jgi:two-component system nitrate/nitrite response regulator NarL